MDAKKILLIEDEELLAGVLQRKLQESGYVVTVAQDGEIGIEKVRKEKPDLILLDMLLPKKDGMEVLEDIRGDAELSYIPVIIISNSGQPVEIERAKELGVQDWLVKTDFDPKEVVEKVNRYLFSQ
ncbi:MAG: response regulator [Candidatus Wildermuthbacteria bacterium]|nr:response regulator [Candidatus Wildermuthbacteria bacterium]